MKKFSTTVLCLVGWLFSNQPCFAQVENQQDINKFVDEMVANHGFDRSTLLSVFSEAEVSNTILEAISRPAEAKPWYQYRPIFIQQERIRMGVEFMAQHEQLLREAERQFGIPPAIITAIIGVETRYGKNAGNYKVIDSLVTLGFNYPKRAEFFRSELVQFLLLTREQKLDPHSVKGSYAGAMGIPQFISSSYRNFAIDFDRDGKIDIWNNPADAIGSVANYFSEHGWTRGQPVVTRAKITGTRYKDLIDGKIEPNLSLEQLSKYGVSAESEYPPATRAKLLSYQIEVGEQLWLGFTNFYVITRYNHSALYAMAVYQLAEEITRLGRNEREDR